MRRLHLCIGAVLVLSACVGGYSSTPSGVGRAEQAVSKSRGVQANCTLTQGFWKNHEESWPVTTLVLGGVTYTQAELLAVLQTAPRGDATYILIHQLIAAELNVAAGADPTDIAGTLADAHAWLAAHPLGSDPGGADRRTGTTLAGLLDDFNNGETGPGHCGPEPSPEPSATPPPG
jgi:hypothetical protein